MWRSCGEWSIDSWNRRVSPEPQPIETAPRDGRVILVLVKPHWPVSDPHWVIWPTETLDVAKNHEVLGWLPLPPIPDR